MIRCENAKLSGACSPYRTRTYHDVQYAAKSWPQTFRVILKAEVMMIGENPRFIITSLDFPTAECIYRDLYCARGQDVNFIKMVKNELFSDRTSDQSFLAYSMRMLFSCAAYVLHHTLKTKVLKHTELAQVQPSTIITKLYRLKFPGF